MIEIEISLLAAVYFAFYIFKFHFTSASNSRRRAYKGKERRVTFPVARREIFMESDGSMRARCDGAKEIVATKKHPSFNGFGSFALRRPP
jgi:hypothetical protein